jgi:hypothetical protein
MAQEKLRGKHRTYYLPWGNMTKTLLTLSLLLVSRFATMAAVDLGFEASVTPYDPYLSPVKRVLGTLSPGNASMDRARELMRIGRSFRYAHTDPYLAALPKVTASRKTGDCKDKALWLADQLRDGGVRYVIGKAERQSKISHAWLMWQHDGKWWILDCTNMSRPVAADQVSKNSYIPIYSYDRSGSYRHSTARLSGERAVAASESAR